jgi:hypothetical protein
MHCCTSSGIDPHTHLHLPTPHNRIFKALKEDIYYVKLRQIAWKEFCKQK